MNFPSSKTDQLQEDAQIFIKESGSFYCPVYFMKRYLLRLNWESRLSGGPDSYEGPLFPSLRQRNVFFQGLHFVVQLPVNLKPFSYKGALHAFRSILSRVNVPDPLLFGLHSGRRGGATAALNAGCPFLYVKRQGRWRSDSVPLLYVDPDLSNLSVFSSYVHF